MTNLELYNHVFIDVLSVNEEQLRRNLKYSANGMWDEVGHSDLVDTLQKTFDIVLRKEDVDAFDSYEKGKEILAKYGVKL